MSRHRAKSSKRLSNKVLGAGIALSLVTLSAGAVATYAGFTDSGSADITATAGSINLVMGSSGTSKTAAINLGTALVPGGTIANQTITLRNTGTLPMKITGAVTGTPGALANTMTVVIKDGTTQLYSGKMNAMAIPNFTLAAAGTKTLTLTFTWANGTPEVDNALMGASANTDLTFSATN